MKSNILKFAIAMAFIVLLGGCATTNPPEDFYQGESPYTMETDTMKRLQLIPSYIMQ